MHKKSGHTMKDVRVYRLTKVTAGHEQSKAQNEAVEIEAKEQQI